MRKSVIEFCVLQWPISSVKSACRELGNCIHQNKSPLQDEENSYHDDSLQEHLIRGICHSPGVNVFRKGLTLLGRFTERFGTSGKD